MLATEGLAFPFFFFLSSLAMKPSVSRVISGVHNTRSSDREEEGLHAIIDNGSYNETSDDQTSSSLQVPDVYLYGDFVDAVLEESSAFWQISKSLFIVNGWDTKRHCSKARTDTWYHVQSTKVGSETINVCTCPQSSTSDSKCVHEYLLEEYGADLFPEEAALSLSNDDEIILFSRLKDGDSETVLNHFSCPSPNKRGLSGRSVVVYDGTDSGQGKWTCLKDLNSPCGHVSMCRKKLEQLLGIIQSESVPAQDGSTIGSVSIRTPKSAGSEKSVSYKPRPPPIWAALPADTLRAQPPLASFPTKICLDEESSCACTSGQQRIFRRPQDSHIERKATIYTLSHTLCVELELQLCRCKKRYIGPDCLSLGLFNYNNKILFSHEILDEYTSAFTTSETPFHAWVSVVSRRYSLRNSVFCSVDIFRSAWFAYARLLSLEDDMQCPRCGTSPDNTIWDGVTLAFNKKHLLSSLEPPTQSNELSVVRDRTVYVPSQQVLPDSYSRSLVRKVVEGPPLVLGAGLRQTNDGSGDGEVDGGTGSKANKELLERLEAIPLAVNRLAGTNPPLSRVFDKHFGNGAVVNKIIAPEAYKRFFLQISSDESVLQMANVPALKVLEDFTQAPQVNNATRLLNVPVLHDILLFEFSHSTNVSNDILAICSWLVERGRTVYHWLSTGCCYGSPKIRERPKYPKLRNDTQLDEGGKRGAKCSKFYSQYGEKRLTGGIIICYGFHCIPRGEGRNDVFSALVTRWAVAPKRVVYDFACALGPYCMTREPEFFAETQFLIDDFHAVGHTKCAPAAFLKTYTAIDPRLRHINSSAGECGNSGLSRIRKSVSYMSQDRAIVYTKVFLSIWNRQRIRSMKDSGI
ncbi:hypothetical protein R3P38DRAFT_3385700 [Favolaschia claudopus]|uniref:SWIM-type domain-containing protein n=1 Tax=Favolaschia claudopus TaxID=2862362 RepID=A0AAW0DTN0_9AGAR